MHKPDDIATRLLGLPLDKLDASARRVAQHVALRKHIARNLAHEPDTRPTLGQRAADAVTSFGGSWPFVGLFVTVLVLWVGVNAVLLASRGHTFDPYPFILLNLFLSMLAAVQAPVILMSQNRQVETDRVSAGHDYEINLKAELEIMLLHEKMDLLCDTQWAELMALQQQQLKLLGSLLHRP